MSWIVRMVVVLPALAGLLGLLARRQRSVGSPHDPAAPPRQFSLPDAFRTRGLEGALFSLRDAGVYVTFEEFKGRSPIERNGVVVETAHGTFHNPLSERFFTTRSSGSTGAASS